MADHVPAKQLRLLTDRDGRACVWTHTMTDRLVPQHRQGGAGGRMDKHRLPNLLWLDSIINGLIESDADLQATAKAWGIKVPVWVKNVASVPVFFPHLHRWFVFDAGGRHEVPAVVALDMMHEVYGDPYLQWKSIADDSPRSAFLAGRGL